jgi:VanZ family protein
LLFKKYISILLVILSILLIIAFTLQPSSASAALAMHFVNAIAKVNNKLKALVKKRVDKQSPSMRPLIPHFELELGTLLSVPCYIM